MYTRCLKQLDQLEEYISISLKLLAKLVRQKGQDTQTRYTGLPYKRATGITGIRQDTGYLRDLLVASQKLREPLSVPMEDYFANIHVDPYLEHFEHKDGFQLKLHFQYLITDETVVDQIKVKLINADDRLAGDIWLASEGHHTISYGRAKVPVTATVCTSALAFMASILTDPDNGTRMVPGR